MQAAGQAKPCHRWEEGHSSRSDEVVFLTEAEWPEDPEQALDVSFTFAEEARELDDQVVSLTSEDRDGEEGQKRSLRFGQRSHRSWIRSRVTRLLQVFSAALVLIAGGYILGGLHARTVPNASVSVTASAPSGQSTGKSGVSASRSSEGNQIIIDIHGDVKKPGLYKLAAGARIADAVRAAGGYRHAEDAGVVNAAELLDDGQEVVIPNAAGRTQQTQDGGASAATVNRSTPGGGSNTAAASGGLQALAGTNGAASTGTAGGGNTDKETGVSGKIDLNTADAATLETLPGIGPARATAIIQYREQHGPFASVQDLDKVTGIGAATLARLSPYLYVSDAGTTSAP
ncbi:helix-hairpin-helix domain-containing protein [Alicyclobacillus herbarius]|uniref:helix-hairpin-helix domain-containing protein n=1 Tax=Alicyclobacillus herbarius TaxID=122960 RepID=UPI000684F4D3|nr:helix-hairpin-helix domain-containing protein [Alicyclobacillus herbarius]